MTTGGTDADFGPLEYEKDLSITSSGLMVRGLIAGLVMVFGVVGVVGGLQSDRLPLVGIGAAMILIAPAAWYFLAYRNRIGRFRFSRHGLESTTSTGTRRLAYNDVVTFTFNATRVYVSRVYSHTDVLMEFKPETGPAVVYHSQDRDQNDDLAQVRDRLSQAVAKRIENQLHSGQAVEWCEGLRLTPAGLEITGGFGKSNNQVVPYDQVDSVSIEKGYCKLYILNSDKPVFEKQVLLPNFFPGLCTLEKLSKRRLLEE